MKKLVTFFLVLFWLPAPGQGWTNSYGWGGLDKGSDIEQAPDGGYIVVGETESFGNDTIHTHALIIKLSENGEEEWSKIFAWEDYCINKAEAVAVTPDGGFLVAGWSVCWPLLAQAYLIKLSADGEELWSKHIGDPLEVSALDIQSMPAGGYIIAGTHWNPDPGEVYNAYLLRIDESGEALWSSSIGGPMVEHVESVQLTLDGGFILAGRIRPIIGGHDFLLIKVDEFGVEEWSKTFGLPENGNENGEEAYSAIQTSDEGYAISGRWSGNRIGVVKTDALGNEEWMKLLNGNNNSNLGGYLVNTNDGNFTVFGGDPGDFYLTSLSVESGDILWQTISVQPYGAFPYGFCLTEAGGYATVGCSNDFSDSDDVYVMVTDENGMVTNSNEAIKKDAMLKIGPNPSSGDITIYFLEVKDEPFNLMMVDIYGRVVFQKTFENNPFHISHNLMPGVYHYSLVSSKDFTVKVDGSLIVN